MKSTQVLLISIFLFFLAAASTFAEDGHTLEVKMKKGADWFAWICGDQLKHSILEEWNPETESYLFKGLKPGEYLIRLDPWVVDSYAWMCDGYVKATIPQDKTVTIKNMHSRGVALHATIEDPEALFLDPNATRNRCKTGIGRQRKGRPILPGMAFLGKEKQHIL